MNQELASRIASSPQLPTLPIIALKVLELTRREDVSAPEIADLIMTDPPLSSKILKTVNSPFYGLTKQVSTVSSALVILGLQAAKTLALGFSLLTHLKTNEKGDKGFDQTLFWKRSIYAAVSSRVLARKFSVIQQEEAFLAGLLANMGSLVLHRVEGEKFDAIFAESKGDAASLNALCQAKLGMTPAEASALLVEKWQLPPLLAQPIALQETPDKADAALKPLVDAVATGLQVAGVFVAEDSAKAIAAAREVMAARFQLPPEEIEKLLEQIGASAREASKVLDMNFGKERSYQEILDEAQETLVGLTLRNQKQMENIQRQVESLQVRATTDPLTGLANRARFDEFFNEQFARAYELQRPLSLLFIDIDHFKKVNDTHGHQAGDEVLRRIARLLRSSVRNIDLVSRYGGEEFAVVLTEADLANAAIRAEAIRAKMEAEVIHFDQVKIKVTLSAGVAGTDRTRVFSQCTQLTNAADRAVYAAKGAGRNCVRVFRPAAQQAAATIKTNVAGTAKVATLARTSA
ncbi:MAG TPA: GGDEF domain-containing protein [Phycisphaerae bacterium]